MNSKSALLAALIAGFIPMAAMAQAAPAASEPAAPAAATAAPPAPTEPKVPPPAAFPARIALINFQQAVILTNEGQRAAMEVNKRYQPQKDKLEALAAEIDSLKKQLQAAPATLPDDERNRRLKEIDTKDKQYQRDTDDASTSYNSDMQEALSKVAEKVHNVMLSYVAKNGYTLLFNVGDQQSPVMWASQDQNADITEAIVDAYNASSGVTAPPPAAPSAGAGAARRPASSGATHPATPHAATPAK
jgi:outer membrane protein